ncbi:MAG: hypothetical protein M3R61_07050, partial [Chloroflexota bacterium]|nr:hypothetical protein [Chloroflexota bacterium]
MMAAIGQLLLHGRTYGALRNPDDAPVAYRLVSGSLNGFPPRCIGLVRGERLVDGHVHRFHAPIDPNRSVEIDSLATHNP